MTTITTIEGANPITIGRIETRDFVAYEIRDLQECYVVARLSASQLHVLLERDAMLWDAGQRATKIAA